MQGRECGRHSYHWDATGLDNEAVNKKIITTLSIKICDYVFKKMRTFKRRDAKVPYKMASVFIKYALSQRHRQRWVATVHVQRTRPYFYEEP